jgi:hypothetical protein
MERERENEMKEKRNERRIDLRILVIPRGNM